MSSGTEPRFNADDTEEGDAQPSPFDFSSLPSEVPSYQKDRLSKIVSFAPVSMEEYYMEVPSTKMNKRSSTQLLFRIYKTQTRLIQRTLEVNSFFPDRCP
eukprot:Rmarinus@m.3014